MEVTQMHDRHACNWSIYIIEPPGSKYSKLHNLTVVSYTTDNWYMCSNQTIVKLHSYNMQCNRNIYDQNLNIHLNKIK